MYEICKQCLHELQTGAVSKMVKPSRSDPSDDDEGIQAWQQQIHEAIASGVSNPKEIQRTSYCKPSRSEPDEAHLSPTASPSERQMWRYQELLRCPEQHHMETITTTSGKQRRSTRTVITTKA